MRRAPSKGKPFAAIPPDPPPDSERRYRRSIDNRRLLMLDLVACAISCVENITEDEDFAAFEQELREVRKRLSRRRAGAERDPRTMADGTRS